MIPSVLPASPVVGHAAPDQSPNLNSRSAGATCRASPKISAHVCSAIASVSGSGLLTTAIPCSSAADTSIFSSVAPARPITRSRSPRWITAAGR